MKENLIILHFSTAIQHKFEKKFGKKHLYEFAPDSRLVFAGTSTRTSRRRWKGCAPCAARVACAAAGQAASNQRKSSLSATTKTRPYVVIVLNSVPDPKLFGLEDADPKLLISDSDPAPDSAPPLFEPKLRNIC